MIHCQAMDEGSLSKLIQFIMIDIVKGCVLVNGESIVAIFVSFY